MKEIYIVKINGFVGAYRVGRCPNIMYARSDKFIDFVKSLIEDYPGYKLRCVINKGIEDEVRKRIAVDLSKVNQRQI